MPNATDFLKADHTHVKALFQAKFKVLMENVEHHIEEEEGEMFPEAGEALGERLERLGTQMKERKQQLMASMQ
jgi:hemerythrin-like domain-containing protein